MNYTEQEELRAKTREFLSTKEWSRPWTITLTMKQFLTNPYRQLTEDAASRNFTRFKRSVNRHFFGKAYKRRGQSVKVVPVLEFSIVNRRLHYHVLMDCPTEDISKFEEVILTSWHETEWGDSHVHMEPASPEKPDGFLSYMTKAKNLNDVVDWVNVELSP